MNHLRYIIPQGITILLFMFVSARHGFAQQVPLPQTIINVRGTIINEAGEPVIATVSVKGKNNSVTTNDKGEFELNKIDAKAILVITSVSIESIEIFVNGKPDVGNIIVRSRIRACSHV